MPLLDEYSGMVDRFGHTSFEHQCLEAAFKKVLNSQGQHVIKLVLALIQQPVPVHPPHKCFTLEYPTWVLLFKSKKHSCSITNAAESILHPPKLPFASKTVFSYKLQLSIQSLLLIRATGLLKSLPI